MRHDGSQAAHLKGPGLLALLLLLVFGAELAVSEFLPLLSGGGRLVGGMLDATLVVLIIAGPLWFFFFRLLPAPSTEPGERRETPGGLLIKALIGVFLVENLAMQLLPELFPAAGARNIVLLDASLICLFLLWFLLRRKALSESVLLMDTPLRLYFLLLCTLFLSNLLQEFILPRDGVPPLLSPDRIVDSLLTTLCGAPLLWFLVVRPLKRAARSEKTRVAAVHAQVIDAIVTMDPQGRIGTLNPAALSIFGYSQPEIVGQSASVLLQQGDAGLETLMQEAPDGSRQLEPPVPHEIGCRRRDGSTLVMSVSISKVLLEPHSPEYLLIMRDITSRIAMEEALRESELRFREIFHQSEDAILFFKPKGCAVLDANAKAEAVFGYSKRELQEGGLPLICEPEEQATLCQVIGAIREGKTAKHDFSSRRRDGERIAVSLRGKPMLLQGVPVTYCTFRDVTDRIRMEERTRDIQAKLIQTNKMTSLGLLVSGVAHEINNPNNFIHANCELLERINRETVAALRECCEEQGGDPPCVAGLSLDELSHHSQRLLDGISEGSRRVDAIVNKLKGFARQERSQVKREIDVNEVAISAVSLLHHELIKYTNRFHLELGKDLPRVEGHGQQLGQVIMNLLMNACQALPGKQSGIWLSTGFDPAEAMATITVRDEGCGMSREDSQRIMEPFFTTKLDCGGTGLGLSISESIVKEHGGTLEFSSAPGEGTTFSVRIPAKTSTALHTDFTDQTDKGRSGTKL